MTSLGEYVLQVELRDSTGETYKRATYDSFSVGPAPRYQLGVSGFSSGDNAFVRDALGDSDGQGFSTFQHDRDGNAQGSCAQDWGGTAAGW